MDDQQIRELKAEIGLLATGRFCQVTVALAVLKAVRAANTRTEMAIFEGKRNNWQESDKLVASVTELARLIESAVEQTR